MMEPRWTHILFKVYSTNPLPTTKRLTLSTSWKSRIFSKYPFILRNTICLSTTRRSNKNSRILSKKAQTTLNKAPKLMGLLRPLLNKTNRFSKVLKARTFVIIFAKKLSRWSIKVSMRTNLQRSVKRITLRSKNLRLKF